MNNIFFASVHKTFKKLRRRNNIYILIKESITMHVNKKRTKIGYSELVLEKQAREFNILLWLKYLTIKFIRKKIIMIFYNNIVQEIARQ